MIKANPPGPGHAITPEGWSTSKQEYRRRAILASNAIVGKSGAKDQDARFAARIEADQSFARSMGVDPTKIQEEK